MFYFFSEVGVAIVELLNVFFDFCTGVSGYNNREDCDDETDAEHFSLESSSESLMSDITSLLLMLNNSTLF